MGRRSLTERWKIYVESTKDVSATPITATNRRLKTHAHIKQNPHDREMNQKLIEVKRRLNGIQALLG